MSTTPYHQRSEKGVQIPDLALQGRDLGERPGWAPPAGAKEAGGSWTLRTRLGTALGSGCISAATTAQFYPHGVSLPHSPHLRHLFYTENPWGHCPVPSVPLASLLSGNLTHSPKLKTPLKLLRTSPLLDSTVSVQAPLLQSSSWEFGTGHLHRCPPKLLVISACAF